MYTRNELKGFWDSILINTASRTALKKLSQNLIVYTTAEKGAGSSHYYTPQTEFFVDKMISPGYLKDQFLGHIWACRLCTWGLRNLFLGVFVHQAYNWYGSYDRTLPGNR